VRNIILCLAEQLATPMDAVTLKGVTATFSKLTFLRPVSAVAPTS
jgi:hypothetical protein